jgi:tetratricopeptide (TPR) repeat protein
MPIDLTPAREHHRRGHFAAAARVYEAALAEDPDRAEALHLLGVVALQRDDPGRALALIGRAVEVAPEEAPYHAALAEAHRMLGRLDRAAECCEQAVQLRPDNPEFRCNLGAILVDCGAIDTALVHFRQAVRLQPDLAAAHNNLGHALGLKGDHAAALAHYRVAAQLEPTAPEVRNNLGKILLDRGEPDEALIHCEAAVRLCPGLAGARVNRGNVLLVLGRLDEAGDSFRAAIRLQPGLAAAHAGLAGALEQQGDLDAAEASLRAALRHDPRHAGVLARLATRLRGKLPEPDRTAIETLLADPALPAEQRSALQFGLAQSLDARGEFERAAALTVEANALQRAEFHKRGRGYDPAAHARFVEQLIAAFTFGFFERTRGWGLDTERPVFVVGLPRSGTTLIEQILASHPHVFGAGELRLAQQSYEGIPGVGGLPLRDCLVRLDRQTTQALARRHLEALRARHGTADRVVDKMPENTLYLGLVATLFPRAKLIHCRRDLRDVALSCWMTSFGQVRWACDADHITSRVAAYRRVMNHWRQVLPVPLLEVDYEDVVADPERSARQLVAWCGLEWDAACLEPHKTRRPVQTASAAQVRQPVYRSSVGRWKNYEHPLAALFAKLEGAL